MSNYEMYLSISSNFDIRAVEGMLNYLNGNSTDIDDYQEGKDYLTDVINQLKTEVKCPKCGKLLYMSDVDGYGYVCTNCDENFY